MSIKVEHFIPNRKEKNESFLKITATGTLQDWGG
jgi:hypothetical protein